MPWRYGIRFPHQNGSANFLPYLTGKAKQGPRKKIFYLSDTADLTALRYNDWKALFMEQKAEGTLRAWIEP